MIATARPEQTTYPIAIGSAFLPARWDAYVNSRREATGFHLSAWGSVIAKAFDHEVRYLAAESHGRIKGILPVVVFRSRLFGNKVVSMPFLNYGGVVADSDESAAALLRAGADLARSVGARFLELRHTAQMFPGQPSKGHKVAMLMRLQVRQERQWDALDRKVRNQIRKSGKSGLQPEIGSVELVRPFYHVFKRNMRDLGTPVYPIGFFRGILSAFPDNSRVFCVWHGKEPVAASMAFWYRRTFHVLSASSLREHNRLCPNMRLYWEMVRYAIDSGHRWFDFGRSSPGSGTYQFKQQWGAEPQPLVWEYWLPEGAKLPDLSPSNPRFKAAIALWQRLPVKLATRFGPSIVRHLP